MVPAGNVVTGVQLLSAQPGPVMPPPSTGAPLLPPELVPPELVPPELVPPELLTPELLTPELLAPELLPPESVAPELAASEPGKPPPFELLPQASAKTATTPAAPNRKMSRRDSESTEALVMQRSSFNHDKFWAHD
jgi:hypothetical protein